jgi:hypothetical protein
MQKSLLLAALLSMIGSIPVAEAATRNYNVVTTWYEPETQPNDSLFIGSFTYDDTTRSVSNLIGILSESMTGSDTTAYPNDSMTWLALNNPLVSWYDSSLHGTFAATFRNSSTTTFWTGVDGSGDGWSPQAGVATGGTYYGWPSESTGIANPGNAYALIFIPDNPLTPLTQAQIDKLAYADCAPGGMMGATCMTGTSSPGYGAIGTMGGIPVSQSITAAVPEPEIYAMFVAGLGLLGFVARRRRAT